MFNITLTLTGTLFAPTANKLAFKGDISDPSEYPFIVSLVFLSFTAGRQTFRACTGSVLNTHWVLSCAHCLKKEYEMGLVTYRNDTLSEKVATKIMLRIETSPEYNIKDDSIVVSDDIALIRLEKLNPKKYGILSPFHYKFLIGKVLIYAGYGMSDLKDDTRLKAPVRKSKGIVRMCPNWVLEYGSSLICLDPLNVHAANALDGDSGGPLFFNGEIIGIMNGVRRNQTRGVIIFTPITDHLPWIESVIT